MQFYFYELQIDIVYEIIRFFHFMEYPIIIYYCSAILMVPNDGIFQHFNGPG